MVTKPLEPVGHACDQIAQGVEQLEAAVDQIRQQAAAVPQLVALVEQLRGMVENPIEWRPGGRGGSLHGCRFCGETDRRGPIKHRGWCAWVRAHERIAQLREAGVLPSSAQKGAA